MQMKLVVDIIEKYWFGLDIPADEQFMNRFFQDRAGVLQCLLISG